MLQDFHFTKFRNRSLGHRAPSLLVGPTNKIIYDSNLNDRKLSIRYIIQNFNTLHHGCAKVAHCVPARWRNFSHYCRPLSQNWRVLSTEKHWPPRRQQTVYTYKRLECKGEVGYIVCHWASREASLRHSSGWGTEPFPLSSVICAPVLYTHPVNIVLLETLWYTVVESCFARLNSTISLHKYEQSGHGRWMFR